MRYERRYERKIRKLWEIPENIEIDNDDALCFALNNWMGVSCFLDYLNKECDIGRKYDTGNEEWRELLRLDKQVFSEMSDLGVMRLCAATINNAARKLISPEMKHGNRSYYISSRTELNNNMDIYRFRIWWAYHSRLIGVFCAVNNFDEAGIRHILIKRNYYFLTQDIERLNKIMLCLKKD